MIVVSFWLLTTGKGLTHQWKCKILKLLKYRKYYDMHMEMECDNWMIIMFETVSKSQSFWLTLSAEIRLATKIVVRVCVCVFSSECVWSDNICGTINKLSWYSDSILLWEDVSAQVTHHWWPSAKRTCIGYII